MNKIDPTKKHFTRDGREVSGLRLQENGKYLSAGVDGNYRVWNLSGEHVCNADLDLVPATEPEGDAVILARARSLITEAMTLCDDRGFNIQSLIHEITSASKNVDMVRKWKLRGSGGKVTILTVSAPNKKYPVIGYADFDGIATSWTVDGRSIWGEDPSSCDLVPDDSGDRQ